MLSVIAIGTLVHCYMLCIPLSRHINNKLYSYMIEIQHATLSGLAAECLHTLFSCLSGVLRLSWGLLVDAMRSVKVFLGPD